MKLIWGITLRSFPSFFVYITLQERDHEETWAQATSGFVRLEEWCREPGGLGCGKGRHQVSFLVLTVNNYIEEFCSHFCWILITYSSVPQLCHTTFCLGSGDIWQQLLRDSDFRLWTGLHLSVHVAERIMLVSPSSSGKKTSLALLIILKWFQRVILNR